MKMGHCKTTSATYLMMLASLSLIWAPAVSGSFGTLFQLEQAKPLAVSTGVSSTTNTLATSAVAQWINRHRALTITTTVAAIGLVAAFAYVIKKYRDNQPPIIPPAPPVPPVEPTRYVRRNHPFVPRLQPIPEESSSTPTTALPSSSTSSQSVGTTSATLNASVTPLAQPTQTSSTTATPSSSSSSAPSSSPATITFAPIHPIEPSSRTVLSSSSSSSTASPSQGRRSPTISGKAQHNSLLQLSPEIQAQLGLAKNLTPEQLHSKLKELCERYEAGRQLFQKICSQHQDLSSSWVEIESSQNLPGEQALSNLMWFFYLYGGLQNERNIFKEGTFRIVDHVDARLTNFFEFTLGADGIQKRLASHFKQCQSYGIDIDSNKCPLPPHGKRHLLLGQPASNEIYLKPENFGVNGFSDGIYHFGEFVIARMCKNNMLQWLFNLESDSAPQNRKEHLPDKIQEQLKKIKKQIHQAHVIEEIRTLVPQLNDLLRDAVDNDKLTLANEIQIALKEIESEYPDWKDRVGNEVVLDVDELLQAPEIIIDGNFLRIRR